MEAQHASGRAAVKAALRDLLALLPVAEGGEVRAVILDREQPATPF